MDQAKLIGEDLYAGDRGHFYHTQRARLRTPKVQAKRAKYFNNLATEDRVLIDIGCGTGGVAASLPAKERIGVEISDHAGAEAAKVLDRVAVSLSDVGDQSADVAISYHALEHFADPFHAVNEIHRVLKPGGLLRICVPCHNTLFDRSHRGWSDQDPNYHLFAWTPRTLGNLLDFANFRVLDARVEPASEGGLLGRITGGSRWSRWVKAARRGMFHTIVSAEKPTCTA